MSSPQFFTGTGRQFSVLSVPPAQSRAPLPPLKGLSALSAGNSARHTSPALQTWLGAAATLELTGSST